MGTVFELAAILKVPLIGLDKMEPILEANRAANHLALTPYLQITIQSEKPAFPIGGVQRRSGTAVVSRNPLNCWSSRSG